MKISYEEAYELARKFEWLQQKHNQHLHSPQEKVVERELKECYDLLARYENIKITSGDFSKLVVLFEGKCINVSGVRYPLAL